MSNRKNILLEVDNERERQNQQWGGDHHDDQHITPEFCAWIDNYSGWASQKSQGGDNVEARKRLIQVAALAVAAVESIDRKYFPHRGRVDKRQENQ